MKALWIAASIALATAGCGTESTSDEPPAAQETAAAVDSPTPTPTPATSPDCESTSADRFEGRALITVTEPCAEATVSSPIAIEGEANVFEATVSLRLLDAEGNVVAEDFTTAMCGTGCWGSFSASLDYNIGIEQSGTLEVYESSAKDGSPIHVVSIPLTLTP